MTLNKKLEYIQNNHFSEWSKMRSKVADEESSKQSIFCICGRLATGLHENGCRKLANRITKITVDRLSTLIPKINEKA